MIHITGLESTYSGKIEFSGISSEAYRKLTQFIAELNGEEIEETHVPLAVDGKKEKDETPEKTVETNVISKSRTKGAESGKEVFNKCKEEIKSLLEYTKEHPDEYEIRFCEAQEFYEENKDKFDGISIITLGNASKALGLERKRQMVNGQPRRVRAYPMKKRAEKSSEEPKKRGLPRKSPVFAEEDHALDQADSLGQMLKKARKDAGLSVYELSNIVEYPYYAIQGWENGSAVPSREAIKVLVSKVSPEFKKYLTA